MECCVIDIYTAASLFVFFLMLSFLLTEAVRYVLISRGRFDVPNARSSHVVPTPRGGGVAIVVSLLAFCLICYFIELVDLSLFLSVIIGGFAISAVGFIDDHFSISTLYRFVVQSMASGFAVYALNGVGSLQWGGGVVNLGALGVVLAFVGIVWAVNLFNFMDGIDGIAGSQAVFMGSGCVIIWFSTGHQASVAPLGGVLAASALGFLVLNWPPARIFMGDVGSGFIGYIIAVLALASARTDPVALWVWVVLGGLFIADATVTLLRRLARREAVHQAHRSHAYQHLSRRRGHRQVTLLFLGVNMVLALPVAMAVVHWPTLASWIALGFIAALCIAFAALGSGRRE
jgi:Fuc2NAc and GlcNAc transferase